MRTPVRRYSKVTGAAYIAERIGAPYSARTLESARAAYHRERPPELHRARPGQAYRPSVGPAAPDGTPQRYCGPRPRQLQAAGPFHQRRKGNCPDRLTPHPPCRRGEGSEVRQRRNRGGRDVIHSSPFRKSAGPSEGIEHFRLCPRLREIRPLRAGGRADDRIRSTSTTSGDAGAVPSPRSDPGVTRNDIQRRGR